MTGSVHVDLVKKVLLDEDPIGIYSEQDKNTDEYDSEAERIAERLSTCKSPEDVQSLVWDVFVRYFGEEIAGSREEYCKIASRLWDNFTTA